MTFDLVNAFIRALELMVSLDPEVIQITFLSLRVSVTAVILATLLGIPLSIVVGLKDFWGKKILLGIVNTGMSFPPVVMGLLLFILFSSTGPLGQLGILLTDKIMILAQFLLALPFIIGISSSAVSGLDKQIMEAAITLGANKKQRVLLVAREARLGLFASMIAAFGGAISEIGAVQIIGGNIRFKTRTLTTAIGREISAGRWDFAMALGIILLMIAFLINLLFTYIQQSNKILFRAD